MSAAQRGENIRRRLAAVLPGFAANRGMMRALGQSSSEATVDTSGEISEGADLVQSEGITGTGVKVGVLSNGVYSLAALQASGDLPSNVTVLSGQAGPATGCPGTSPCDEGTAMLEIVYDLAPGAQLFFATGETGEAQMVTNIRSLAAAGCNIIVDDMTYPDEGVFQDGTIAQEVTAVTSNGVLYFSSAQNSGNLDSGTSGTWEGDFNPGGTITITLYSLKYLDTTVSVHAFDATHIYDEVTQTSSEGSPTSLKWSDPLSGSCNDYDLFILDSTLSTIIESSTNYQTCSTGSTPYESVSAPAAGDVIVVALYSGSTRALHLDTERAQLAINTSGATFGHNAAASALTVAATPAQSTIFTSGNQVPEWYSSDGPRRVFYNSDGTEITPGNDLFSTNGGTTLSKVDFTAADCGQTAVPPPVPNPFCGTSAAAPTAAAIAALMMSANPSLTPSQVTSVMKSTALVAKAGFNSRTVGAGIVMANLSVDKVLPTLYAALMANPPSGAAPLSVTFTATPSGTASGTYNYTFWWNCANPGTSVSTVSTICGDPTNPAVGAKFDAVTDNPKAVTYAYTSAGSYTPKVIIERGTAAPAESRAAITVSAAPAPNLLSPANGTNFPSGTTSATLQWTSVSNAIGYGLEVYTGSCGGPLFLGVDIPAPSTSISWSDGGIAAFPSRQLGQRSAAAEASWCSGRISNFTDKARDRTGGD